MSQPSDTVTKMMRPAAENGRRDVPAGILVTTRPTNPLAAHLARELFAARRRRPMGAAPASDFDVPRPDPVTPASASESAARQLFRALTDGGEYPLGSVLAPACSCGQVTQAVRAAIERAEEPQ